ncbi:hypothetical protein Taro_026547 [Colocasia esculenta]|uniref:Photosystem II 5 kDa protein, chloroplastic n=1 Tax=Colocasia esculenta TaxID=4460 RepID=A0A843VNW7_COLES|nr:hypothetical protein [Colocasia esculenta]
MASFTMAASFMGPAGVAERPSAGRRRLLVVKAAAENDGQGVAPRDGPGGRRAVVLAVAAAAISAAGKAVAEVGDPKRGTSEAKKKYAPICVTMPTASVCHK